VAGDVRLALIAVIIALACCTQAIEPRAVVQEVAEDADDKGRTDETIEQPESVPDTVEPKPEPSPYLAGWIYLLDAEDTVIYSHEEPSAQLRAAYYDMMNMWNRQERDGHPFRVVEGG
jgi:hypothetical protein